MIVRLWSASNASYETLEARPSVGIMPMARALLTALPTKRWLFLLSFVSLRPIILPMSERKWFSRRGLRNSKRGLRSR